MAVYTSIDNPAEYFETVLYTGNGASTPGGSGSTQTISSLDFSPNLVWIKDRTSAHNHNLIDTVRGAPNILQADNGNVEVTDSSDALTSFTSNGFVIGDNGEGTQLLELNKSSNTYVAWCWNESATAGFDIVSYTGNATDDVDISHSLSAVPHVIIVKNRDNSNGESWAVYHHKNTSAPETDRLYLNTTGATGDDDEFWSDEVPTSSVFTIGRQDVINTSSGNHIAYLWSEKQGFSKFGSYTSNNNSNGPFIYTGFRPRFVLVKNIDATGSWMINDTARDTFNTTTSNSLMPDLSNAEDVNGEAMDILSNGFKCRATGVKQNTGSNVFIYMAFAEAPFVNSNGVPCNAR